jgi:flagellar hook-length control protein FliK
MQGATPGLRPADLKADAELKEKAAQGKVQPGANESEAGFAGATVEQRDIDTSMARQTHTASGARDAAAANPAAFATTLSAASATPAAAAVAIATPLTAPEFTQALGLQMSVLMRDGVQHAELHLNPAEMGPVSVQIVMDGTQARVEFGADMAATRQAIEAGLPELASALREAGFTLAGGGVSQHSRGRSDADGSASDRNAGRRQPARDDAAVGRVSAAARRIVSAGGVDLFA